MRILVLQHIACEHPGIFRDLMERDGISWDAVELDEGEPIPDMRHYDMMMVMGGPMDVWQKEVNPWLVTEIEAIRDWVVDRRKPYLGFCLGHQLLAEALGGEVGPAALPEIGILDVTLTAEGKSSPFLKNCPQTIPCLQWHSAEITALPQQAHILASSDACKVNAMSWGDNAFSVQFHIEMTGQTVPDWAEIPEYAGALEKALGVGALAEIKSGTDEKMAQFNQLSEIIYQNMMAVIRAGN
jgi:GMP synthase-like glutamine amidotransferase